MILPESRNLEWIEKASADNHASNPILVEKVIRAFSLLEALARSGCPFIFKGGSSLMLHFGSSRRLSIDVDIICPPGTDIEKYWSMYAGDYGFTPVEAVDRYWVKNADGTFEVLDGQQRTISFCSYHAGEFIHVVDGSLRGWANLTQSQKDRFLNYELQVYICEGTPEEILKWFRIINIAGMKLTDQELRNAAYYGPWLTEAKKRFSKSSCVASKLGGDYVSGNPIRQELLETALEWIASRDGLKGGLDKDPIAEYMAIHQNDNNCDDLWGYFQDIIHWIQKVFPNYRKQMKGLPWGILYNEHKDDKLQPTELEEEVVWLLKDSDVQKMPGIWPYLLTKDEKYLSIRAFDENTKVTVYERQEHHCANPDCPHGKEKTWDIFEMEADHITPWSKGGHTVIENCQLLCRDCNRR